MRNRTTLILAIIILSILTIAISSFVVMLLKGNIHFGFKRISNELVLDETYQNIYSTLRIDSDASDIEIINTTEDKIKVTIYGDKDYTNVDQNGNTLSISSKSKKCFGFCFNLKMAKITIYLPIDFDGKIDASNKYGDIDIDSFENAEVIVDEDCGDVKIKKVKTVEIENSYGDITVDKATKAKIKEDCGDIKIGEITYGDIVNNLGDIKIEKVLEKIDIDEACGNVSITDLSLTENSSIKNSLGDIKIGATGEIYFDASVSLGDIKINNNYRNADVTLKIDNSCGDIKVNN